MVCGELSYNEFLSYFEENIEAYLLDMNITSVEICTMNRNNGLVCDSLMVRHQGKTCFPVLYMKDFYSRYMDGADVDALVSEAALMYRSQDAAAPEVTEEFIMNFANVRDKIVFKAVNYEKNAGMLTNSPYIKRMDLAVSCRIMMIKESIGMASVLVTNTMLRLWEITEYDLYDLAMANTRRIFAPTLTPISTVLFDHYPETLPQELQDEIMNTEEVPEMYVLSNDMRINGAVEMFCSDSLKNFAVERQCDVYILPSSIHEVLLIPKREDMDAEALKSIVSEVNQHVVEDEDILSDSVYQYILKENRIVLC